METFEVHLGGI